MNGQIVVDTETGTWGGAEIPEYSDFPSLSEEEQMLNMFEYNNLGVMDGKLVVIYTLPSKVNQSEFEFRVCLQDGGKETVLFRDMAALKDIQKIQRRGIASGVVTDFANGKLYYFDISDSSVGCIDLKTREVQKICSIGEDFSQTNGFYTVSGAYLYTMETDMLRQINLKTLEEKQYPLPKSAERYHQIKEFSLAPCDDGGCWIYREDTSRLHDPVRFLPDQAENGGFTLYETKE